jgi:hypothetical protein
MIRLSRLPIFALLLLLVSAPATSENRLRTTSERTAARTSPVTSTTPPAVSVQPTAPKSGSTEMTTGSLTPLYKLEWYTVSGGGIMDASSASYKMGMTAGQSVIGDASSANYRMGVGFWYGTEGCSCPSQGDVDSISSPGIVDVFDVIREIDIVFSGGQDSQDPACPTSRANVERTKSPDLPDVFDVIRIIDIAFSNASPDDPCNP